jgi:hypothetical protein
MEDKSNVSRRWRDPEVSGTALNILFVASAAELPKQQINPKSLNPHAQLSTCFIQYQILTISSSVW